MLTVNVFVCGVPQTNVNEVGDKVNVGFGLDIEIYLGVPSKKAPLQSLFAIY